MFLMKCSVGQIDNVYASRVVLEGLTRGASPARGFSQHKRQYSSNFHRQLVSNKSWTSKDEYDARIVQFASTRRRRYPPGESGASRLQAPASDHRATFMWLGPWARARERASSWRACVRADRLARRRGGTALNRHCRTRGTPLRTHPRNTHASRGTLGTSLALGVDVDSHRKRDLQLIHISHSTY